jgi:hypothetical protein
MIFIRVLLICLIAYLIVRSFANYWKEEKLSEPKPEKKDHENKKVSKKIGEYVDYEEVDKSK